MKTDKIKITEPDVTVEIGEFQVALAENGNLRVYGLKNKKTMAVLPRSWNSVEITLVKS